MPHRTRENEPNSYSDLDWQAYQVDLISQDGPTNDSEGFNLHEEVEPIETGLDNDEMAELVWARYHLSLETPTDSTIPNSPGTITGRGGVGINVGEREWIQKQTADDTNSNLGNNGDFKKNVTIGEANGELYYTNISVGRPYKGGGGEGGAGEMHKVQVETRNFRHEMGTGPWLDATDDISINLSLGRDSFDSQATLTLRAYHGYWVQHVEGGRPTLAPPSHGD